MRRFLGLAGWVVGALTFGAAAEWATDPRADLGIAKVLVLWLICSGALVGAAMSLYHGYEEREHDSR